MASSAVVGLLRVLLTANTGEFSSAMKSAAREAKAWASDLDSVGKTATAVGSTLTKTLTLPIVTGLGLSAKAAMDFESSFAGVRKTVNATEPEFAALAQGMRNLAKTIPVNVNELNKIGEAAGQLGIQTENILGFTDVMAKLGVTTNLSSDEAATSLARLANITQMNQGDFDRLGATVVHLGNNFATTEREIVEFGTRIAGAGKIAGLTEHQILAIGTAMSSVGVQAEAGGTAVQKVLNKMTAAVATGNADLEKFAKAAGKSSEEFAAAYRKDAGAAFADFVTGLGKQGDKAFATLNGLKLGNERVVRAFLSLANAGDLLTNALRVGEQGWRENTALAEEAGRRFETTHSQLTILWNRLTDVAITVGSAMLPAIRSMIGMFDALVPVLMVAADMFAAMPGPLQLVALGLAGVVAAIGPLGLLIGQAAKGAHILGTALGMTGVAADKAAILLSKGRAAAAALELATIRVTRSTALAEAATTKHGAASVQAAAARARLAQAEMTLTAAQIRATAASRGVAAATTATTAAHVAGAANAGMLAGALAFLGKAVVAILNPLTLFVGGLGLAGLAIYKVMSAETGLETAFRSNEQAFKSKTDTLRAALTIYESLKNKQNLTKEETKALEAATLALAAASGTTADRFNREEESSDTLTAALRRQLTARQDLLNARVGQLRDEAQQAQSELNAAQEQLRKLQAGEATRLKQTGPGGALAASKLTPQEELAEFERLTNLIDELGKKADETKGRLNAMKGATSENVTLNRDVSTAQKEAAASADFLAAAQERLTEANLKYSQELKGKREALKFDIQQMKNTGDTVKVLAARYAISEQTVNRFKSELESSVSSHKKAEKAIAAHTKELEKQRAALSKLGIVTQTTVNEALNDLAELELQAMAGGAQYNTVLAAMVPLLEELHEKALRSGVGIDQTAAALTRAKDAAARVRAELVALVPVLPVISGLSAMPGVLVDINMTGARAAGQARVMAEAFKFFGITSQAELQRTADAAVVHYETIRRSGTSTPREIQAAFDKMIAAQVAAAGKMVVTWMNSLGAISQMMRSVGAVFNGVFGNILKGAADVVQGIDNIAKATTNLGKVVAAVDLGARIGTMLRPLLGLNRGKLGALLGTNNQARNDVEAFAESLGGFEVVQRRLLTLGPEGQRLWKQLTQLGDNADVEEAAAAIAAVNAALERQQEEFRRLATEGGIASKAMVAFRDSTRDSAETLAFIKGQTQEAATGLSAYVQSGAAAYSKLTELQKAYADASGSDRDKIAKDIATQQALIDAIGISSQQAASGIGAALAGAVGEMQAQGVPLRLILEELGPGIAAFQQQLDATGFSGGEAFAQISRFATIASHEIAGPALDAINNLSRGLQGAHNAGFLTQEMFAGMVGQIMHSRQAILDQGVAAEDVNALMQRDLQAIWQLQKDFNFEVDDATQLLLDEAEAAGTVGDRYRSAMDRAAIAMEKVAKLLDDLFNGARKLGDGLDQATRPRTVRVGYDVDDPPPLPGSEQAQTAATGGMVSAMGRIVPATHFGVGGTVSRLGDMPGRFASFVPKGEDTVPAMLSPGELILNEAHKNNLAHTLNSAMGVMERGLQLAQRTEAPSSTSYGGDTFTVDVQVHVAGNIDAARAEEVGIAIAEGLRRGGELRTKFGDQVVSIVRSAKVVA